MTKISALSLETVHVAYLGRRNQLISVRIKHQFSKSVSWYPASMQNFLDSNHFAPVLQVEFKPYS